MNTKKILFGVAIVFACLSTFQVSRAADVDSEEQNFVNILNDYRKSLGRTELKLTKPLLNGAEFFAQDFADHPDDYNISLHIDTTGNPPEERGQKYGYYFLAENIGWGYETGQAMFDGWKASEGHRENMINEGARTIGIARVHKPGATKDGVTSEWFWVADFSDEGVERLLGNGLKTDELYSPNSYHKMTVTMKRWSKKYKKYKKGRWAEIKVYDKRTGQLLDRDIGDKKGKCAVYISGDSRDVQIKVAKFKGNKTTKFTLKGKLTSKGKVRSKNATIKKNIKFEVRT